MNIHTVVDTFTPPSIDEKEPVSSPKNAFITKITMECMMNKKHYKTYLARTQPDILEESIKLQHKIENYGPYIEEIFHNLLDHSKENIMGVSNLYNNDVQQSFSNFITHSLKHIKEHEFNHLGQPKKLINTTTSYSNIQQIMDDEEYVEEVDDGKFSSVWGKSITKMH
jgi:hypothetical protein